MSFTKFSCLFFTIGIYFNTIEKDNTHDNEIITKPDTFQLWSHEQSTIGIEVTTESDAISLFKEEHSPGYSCSPKYLNINEEAHS